MHRISPTGNSGYSTHLENSAEQSHANTPHQPPQSPQRENKAHQVIDARTQYIAKQVKDIIAKGEHPLKSEHPVYESRKEYVKNQLFAWEDEVSGLIEKKQTETPLMTHDNAKKAVLAELTTKFEDDWNKAIPRICKKNYDRLHSPEILPPAKEHPTAKRLRQNLKQDNSNSDYEDTSASDTSSSAGKDSKNETAPFTNKREREELTHPIKDSRLTKFARTKKNQNTSGAGQRSSLGKEESLLGVGQRSSLGKILSTDHEMSIRDINRLVFSDLNQFIEKIHDTEKKAALAEKAQQWRTFCEENIYKESDIDGKRVFTVLSGNGIGYQMGPKKIADLLGSVDVSHGQP